MLTIPAAATLLDTSTPTATKAIGVLAQLHILHESLAAAATALSSIRRISIVCEGTELQRP
jgi:hypothetical protein